MEKPNISDRYCLMDDIWNVSFKTTPTEEQLLIITSIKTDLKPLHTLKMSCIVRVLKLVNKNLLHYT